MALPLSPTKPRVFVGFSTPRLWNPFSALIRVMSGSPFSHAWLLVEDPFFQLRLVMEAHTTGFRLISLARFVKDNKVLELVVPAHSLEAGLPETGEWLGDAYDVRGLFSIFLATLGQLITHKKIADRRHASKGLFCSEAVVRSMKAANYPGAHLLGNETTSPSALFEFFKKDPGSKILTRKELKLWTDLKKTGLRKARSPRVEPPAGG